MNCIARMLWGVGWVLIGTMLQGGCALPRAVWLDVAMRHDVPVLEGGKRVKLQVQPSVQANSPGAGTEIDSPLSVEETQKWYEEMFAHRGWTSGSGTGHVCQDGTIGKDYTRWPQGWVAALFNQSASLEVRPRPDGKGSRVKIEIFGSYIWDWPSKLPYLPFYWTLGESDKSICAARLLSWL